MWDRIYEETHAGGGGDVLKELWPTPTLEQSMSLRSRRGELPISHTRKESASNLPVPAGVGSRLRLGNRRVKLSLRKRQGEEGVGIVIISPSFSLSKLILTGNKSFFPHWV